MINTVRVGCNDIEKARAFYDSTFDALGYGKSAAPKEYPILMYPDPTGGAFLVGAARDGQPATHANGGTISFIAKDNAAVDAWYAAGMANGGTCEGPPGPRPQASGAYGAYLRDPDGNKLAAYNGLNVGGPRQG